MYNIIDGEEPRENSNVTVIETVFKDSGNVDLNTLYNITFSMTKIKLKQIS